MTCPTPEGECLVALGAAVAAQLAVGRSADELAVMAAFLTALADNLALIAARRAITEAAAEKSRDKPCSEGQNSVQ